MGCQIFADVLDCEIRQVWDPICANARGAAWIAALGLGEVAFSDIPGLVAFKCAYAPGEENRVVYDEPFDIFKDVYRQMRPIYHRLNH